MPKMFSNFNMFSYASKCKNGKKFGVYTFVNTYIHTVFCVLWDGRRRATSPWLSLNYKYWRPIGDGPLDFKSISTLVLVIPQGRHMASLAVNGLILENRKFPAVCGYNIIITHSFILINAYSTGKVSHTLKHTHNAHTSWSKILNVNFL